MGIMGIIPVEAFQNYHSLAANPYPGRGIVIGVSEWRRYMVQIYWIMGRSENSRNRTFGYDPEEGCVFTEAADPAKVEDPSLIIYNTTRRTVYDYVVSNGKQTDDVIDRLLDGDTFFRALRNWTYEPDRPNHTPRITGICRTKD